MHRTECPHRIGAEVEGFFLGTAEMSHSLSAEESRTKLKPKEFGVLGDVSYLVREIEAPGRGQAIVLHQWK